MKLHMPLWNGSEIGEALSQSCQHYAQHPGTDHYVFYEKCLKPSGICHLAGVLLDRGIIVGQYWVFIVHVKCSLLHRLSWIFKAYQSPFTSGFANSSANQCHPAR